VEDFKSSFPWITAVDGNETNLRTVEHIVVFVAGNRHVFLVSTVVRAPGVVRTVSDRRFVANAFDVVQPDTKCRIRAVKVVQRLTNVSEAQSIACDSGICVVERIVADCSPFTVMVDFQSTFSGVAAANQSRQVDRCCRVACAARDGNVFRMAALSQTLTAVRTVGK
jgi:hypothetical protein